MVVRFKAILRNSFLRVACGALPFLATGCGKFGGLPLNTPQAAASANSGSSSMTGDVTGTTGANTVATVGGDSAAKIAAAVNQIDSLGGTLGTGAAMNAGTAAGNLVALDSQGRLPAVDGSQLKNLPSPNLSNALGVLPIANGGTNASTALAALTNLAGGNAPNSAGGLVQLDGSTRLPAVDGTQLTYAVSAAITTSGNVPTTDRVVVGDAHNGTITLTLPAASSSTGRKYVVKRKDSTSFNAAASVIVAGNGADKIDTAASVTLSAQFASVSMISDGAQWLIYNQTKSLGGPQTSGTLQSNGSSATLDFDVSFTATTDIIVTARTFLNEGDFFEGYVDSADSAINTNSPAVTTTRLVSLSGDVLSNTGACHAEAYSVTFPVAKGFSFLVHNDAKAVVEGNCPTQAAVTFTPLN